MFLEVGRKFGIKVEGGTDIHDGTTLTVPDNPNLLLTILARLVACEIMADTVEWENGTRLGFNGWRTE